MIDERKKEGWQFFFIGAEPKAIENAVRHYGFSESHAAAYNPAAPDQAFSLLSEANVAARAGLKTGFRPRQPRERKAAPKKPTKVK
jgi:hypothetical protein